MPFLSRHSLFIVWCVSLIITVLSFGFLKPILEHGTENYPDILVSPMIWLDGYKKGDLLFLLSGIGIFFVSFSLLVFLIRKGIEFGKTKHYSFSIFILLGVMTFIFSSEIIGFHFVNGNLLPFCAILLLPPLVHLFSNQRSHFSSLIICILAPIFTFFSLVGVLCALYYFSEGNIPQESIADDLYILFIAITLAVLLMTLIFFVRNNNKGLRNSLMLSQIFIPFLLLRYCLIIFKGPQGPYLFFPPLHTQAFFFLLLLLGFYMLRRASTRKVPNPLDLRLYIPLTTIVTVTLYVIFQHQTGWSVLSNPNGFYSNDIQTAEAILPWHQIFEKNRRLFIDFCPVYGAPSILFGLLNSILGEGTLSTLWFGIITTRAFLSTVNASIIYFCFGPLWSLLTIISMNVWFDRYHSVSTFYLILLIPRLFINPHLWLATFALLSIFQMLYYNSTTGVALVLAFIPFVLYQLFSIYKKFKRERKPFKLRSFLTSKEALLCFLAFVIIYHHLPNLRGVFEHLLLQGSANRLAYPYMTNLLNDFGGKPTWFPDWFSNPAWNSYFYLSFKTLGYIWVNASLFFIGYKAWLDRKGGSLDLKALLLSISWGIFTFVMMPVTLTGIDSRTVATRDGTIVMLFFGFFLPIYLACVKNWKGYAGAMIVGLGLGINFAFANLDVFGMSQTPLTWFKKAYLTVIVPQDYVKVSSLTELQGLNRLGTGYVPLDRLVTGISLNRALLEWLNPNETYFDMANREAFYYLLNKETPSLYAFSIQMSTAEIQEKVLKQLIENRPPVVWVGPSEKFHTKTPALSAYRIYRWFIEQKYQYVEKFGLQFLVSPERLSVKENPMKGYSVNAFTIPDLQLLPTAWGRSIKTLEKRFVSKFKLDGEKIDGKMSPSSITWSFSIPETKCDFLKVTFMDLSPRIQKGDLFWMNEKRRRETFSFFVGGNTFLIPVGIAPQWLLSDKEKWLALNLYGSHQNKAQLLSVEGLRLIH